MGKKIYGLDLNNIGAESLTTKRGVADSECSYVDLDFHSYTDSKANANDLYWAYQNNQDYLWEAQLSSGGEGEEPWYTAKLVFVPEINPNMVYYLIFDENYGYKLCTPEDISKLTAVYLIKCSGGGPK